MKQIEKARQLLPWYITGKLSSFEMKLVKEAINSCSFLHDEYKVQKALSQMVKKDSQLMAVSAISTQDQRMDALMQRIRTEKTIIEPLSTLSFFSQTFEYIKKIVSDVVYFPPSRWAFAVVASLVLIQVVMLNFGSNDRLNDYTLMSEDAAIEVNNNSIIIYFDPKVTQNQCLTLLQALDGRVMTHVAGSSTYQFVFSKKVSSEQIDAVLIKMESNKLIQFVGRGF